jgi:hypothetical protein
MIQYPGRHANTVDQAARGRLHLSQPRRRRKTAMPRPRRAGDRRPTPRASMPICAQARARSNTQSGHQRRWCTVDCRPAAPRSPLICMSPRSANMASAAAHSTADTCAAGADQGPVTERDPVLGPAGRRIEYLRAQVPGHRCLHCPQTCHLCTCLSWLLMTCAGRSRVQGEVGAGIRVVTRPGAAGWRHPGEEFHGGNAGSWAMSVVQTTALDPNSGMSAAGRRSCATTGTSEGRRSRSADPAARLVRPRRGGGRPPDSTRRVALPVLGSARRSSHRLLPVFIIRRRDKDCHLAGSSPEVQLEQALPHRRKTGRGDAHCHQSFPGRWCHLAR